jgi:hypothetical protein
VERKEKEKRKRKRKKSSMQVDRVLSNDSLFCWRLSIVDQSWIWKKSGGRPRKGEREVKQKRRIECT